MDNLQYPLGEREGGREEGRGRERERASSQHSVSCDPICLCRCPYLCQMLSLRMWCCTSQTTSWTAQHPNSNFFSSLLSLPLPPSLPYPQSPRYSLCSRVTHYHQFLSCSRLGLHLPHRVEGKKSKARWLTETHTLEVSLQLNREYDFLNQ